VLDADTSGQGTLGQRGVRHREDRADHDDGTGNQGRREQIRHAGEELRRARWQEGAHSVGRPVRLRGQAEDHVQVSAGIRKVDRSVDTS